MESGPDTTADADPVDEQRGGAAGLRHLPVDQLVRVDEIVPLDDRVADLDHGEHILALAPLVDGERRVRGIRGEVVGPGGGSPFLEVLGERNVAGLSNRPIGEVEGLPADVDEPEGFAIRLEIVSRLNEHELRFQWVGGVRQGQCAEHA